MTLNAVLPALLIKLSLADKIISFAELLKVNPLLIVKLPLILASMEPVPLIVLLIAVSTFRLKIKLE